MPQSTAMQLVRVLLVVSARVRFVSCVVRAFVSQRVGESRHVARMWFLPRSCAFLSSCHVERTLPLTMIREAWACNKMIVRQAAISETIFR